MADSKRETLSILTLTRTFAYAARLTAALDEQEKIDADVSRVLVNNAATRKRTGYHPITEFGAKNGWAVVEPGYNTSFSAGNNLAAKVFSTANYYLLLNDDLQPRPDFLRELWAGRRRFDVTGALILHSDGTVNHAGTKVYPWPDHIARGAPSVEAGLFQREAVTFAAALIDGAVYRRFRLDERYHYSFEDTDFCLRVIDAAGTVGVNLAAVATHDECGTRERHGPQDVANAKAYAERWPERVVKDVVQRYWDRIGGK